MSLNYLKTFSFSFLFGTGLVLTANDMMYYNLTNGNYYHFYPKIYQSTARKVLIKQSIVADRNNIQNAYYDYINENIKKSSKKQEENFEINSFNKKNV